MDYVELQLKILNLVFAVRQGWIHSDDADKIYLAWLKEKPAESMATALFDR